MAYAIFINYWYNVIMEIRDLKLTKRRSEIVERLGLSTVKDILAYYPMRYEVNEISKYEDFNIGARVVFIGEILTHPSTFRFNRSRSSTKFNVLVEDEYELALTLFNRPWANKLNIGEQLLIVGTYQGNDRVTVINYYANKFDEVLGIVPVYPLKEDISQNDIRKIIKFTMDKALSNLDDDIPSSLREAHHLISYQEAIKEIHYPSSKFHLSQAVARFKYEEFLKFYLSLAIIKGQSKDNIKNAKVFDKKKIEQLVNSFEYDLTADQKTSLDEILKDLGSNHLMYRLLQGDVGSGKTSVAMLALYANYLSGYKGALMAPTEILAKQHAVSFKTYLEPLGLRIEALYSSSKDKKEIKEKLANGEIDIIIGTHALFSEDIVIDNLGLVITDEQQRFGVKQRRKLKEKGDMVDFLLMSATPIPRTLATSLYGDMDVSTIETMPKGRKGCDTYYIKKNSIKDIIPDLLEVLKAGQQIYIIAAAIEKSDNYKAKDATQLYTSLKTVFKDYELGLLHGKMSAQEKEKEMMRFETNQSQILVSTTVVEVGVNVKNATCMVIYDADRFGMAQLHQLRGRVQRSSIKGKCYLLSDSKDELVSKRLTTLENVNNGFEISREDLKLRGPGDILGTRQSGLPSFVLGDIINDTRIIEAARKDASALLESHDDYEAKRLYLMMFENANRAAID